ncbi:hypothetical protein M6B38_268375 [Iris pallida]|uniref:Uncharacterized protein n=1 Tax=Iris pallida TaxID=29817 RepID=A0AAX6IBD6_IRIPA|nr:hypothetical protein M6B38_268375 [Iris pallida]
MTTTQLLCLVSRDIDFLLVIQFAPYCVISYQGLVNYQNQVDRYRLGQQFNDPVYCDCDLK